MFAVSQAATLTRSPEERAEKKTERSLGRRVLGRTTKIIVVLVVLFVVLPPALTKGRAAVSKLGTVNPLLLVLGLGLEIGSLLAYSVMTRAALPKGSVSLGTLFRIQMSTKAVTNVVPAGSAAGSALGYRLLVLTGVAGADAGFALATVGLGSALVLNLMLWATLLVSIPFAGWSPIYVTVALVGVFLFTVFGAIVLGLMKGQTTTERLIRAIARKLPVLNEDRMGELVQRLARRLRHLIADRELVRRLIGWATLNWLLDAAALWVFLRAFGATTRPDGLIIAFCAAYIISVIPITPGGLGPFDVTMGAVLAGFGVGVAAGFGVPIYRVAQYALPIPLGTVAYFTLRYGRWRIDTERRLTTLRHEAAVMVERGDNAFDWAEQFGPQLPLSGTDLAEPAGSGPAAL
jgi:uncharacterized protein (TIRG00374 family)